MPRSTIRRLLAATFLAILASGSVAHAQQPPCNNCTSPDGRTIDGRTIDGTVRPPLLATTQVSPSSHDYLRHPTGCWQHHNSDYSCSSLSSELIFIFGGCRHFFGEPCLKGPPVYGNPFSSCPTGVGCKKRGE